MPYALTKMGIHARGHRADFVEIQAMFIEFGGYVNLWKKMIKFKIVFEGWFAVTVIVFFLKLTQLLIAIYMLWKYRVSREIKK